MIGKICAGLALGTFVVVTASVPSASAASLKVRVDSSRTAERFPLNIRSVLRRRMGKWGQVPT